MHRFKLAPEAHGWTRRQAINEQTGTAHPSEPIAATVTRSAKRQQNHVAASDRMELQRPALRNAVLSMGFPRTGSAGNERLEELRPISPCGTTPRTRHEPVRIRHKRSNKTLKRSPGPCQNTVSTAHDHHPLHVYRSCHPLLKRLPRPVARVLQRTGFMYSLGHKLSCPLSLSPHGRRRISLAHISTRQRRPKENKRHWTT